MMPDLSRLARRLLRMQGADRRSMKALKPMRERVLNA